MSTTTTKTAIINLDSQVSRLQIRLIQLVDDLTMLKEEVGKFKQDVASDVKYLTERIDG